MFAVLDRVVVCIKPPLNIFCGDKVFFVPQRTLMNILDSLMNERTERSSSHPNRSEAKLLEELILQTASFISGDMRCEGISLFDIDIFYLAESKLTYIKLVAEKARNIFVNILKILARLGLCAAVFVASQDKQILRS